MIIFDKTRKEEPMKVLRILVLFSLPLVLAGCTYLVVAGAGAGAGVATYAYVKGELKVEYPYSYDAVWNATLAALRDCRIMVEEKARDALGGTIKAKRHTGTRVRVKVENKGPKLTVVKIRVGLFGNKDASFMIKEAIDKRLGAG